MKGRTKNLLHLFLSFLKIGAFTFGGGYAMIALIENECVTKKKWLSMDEMMDITVIAESTPGPVAINTATFVGYKIGGVFGSFCATFGVVLPSFVIIYFISMFLKNFLEITWVANAFRGIKVAVAFLIARAGIRMLKKMPKNLLSCAIFVFSFIALILIDLFALRFSTIYMILISAVIGLVLMTVRRCREVKKK